MSMKDIVSRGEDFIVEQVERGYGGARKELIHAHGDTGQVDLEGKNLGSLFKASGFTGVAAAGAATLTTAQKGDVVLGVVNLAGGDAASSFESVISVSGQIQQSSASDLSAAHFMVLLLKRGATPTP